MRDIGVRIALFTRVFFAALTLVAALATALVYGVGGVLAIHGTLTVGTLVALAALLLRLFGPLHGLSNVRVDVMTALVSFERVFEVLDLPTADPGEARRRRRCRRRPRSLEFDHVRVPLPARRRGLAGLARVGRPRRVARHRRRCCTTSRFTAEPGQLVALVGPVRRGQDHDHPPGRPALRRRSRQRSASAATTCAT